MRTTLPWVSCETDSLIEFTTEQCYTKYDNDLCNTTTETYWAKDCVDKDVFCKTFGYTGSNGTHCTFSYNDTSTSISKVRP